MAIITPIILAIEILMVRPKVSTNIPKSSINGEDNPKVCPYDNQLKKETPDANSPIKPPSTMPASNSKKHAQVFLLLLIHFLHSIIHFNTLIYFYAKTTSYILTQIKVVV